MVLHGFYTVFYIKPYGFIWFCAFLYLKPYGFIWFYMVFIFIFFDFPENLFGHFWQFFDNIWYFWPRNINIHIHKIHFASTRNSGSPFFGFKLQFLFLTFLIYFINFEVILTYVNQFGSAQLKLLGGQLGTPNPPTINPGPFQKAIISLIGCGFRFWHHLVPTWLQLGD